MHSCPPSLIMKAPVKCTQYIYGAYQVVLVYLLGQFVVFDILFVAALSAAAVALVDAFVNVSMPVAYLFLGSSVA